MMMNRKLILILCISLHCAMAQGGSGRVLPIVTSIPIDPGSVTVLHLSPGYATSVKVPEDISSVVIGDPATFKAEHSESEPRLTFFKPTTPHPAESNALITTKSGQEISLHLVSDGRVSNRGRVDFFLEYRQPHSLVIGESDPRSFLIAETKPLIASTVPNPEQPQKVDDVGEALKKQETLSLSWQGKHLAVGIGESTSLEHKTLLAFSVINRSNKPIELLAPQIQLSGRASSKKHPQIKAEPVPISEFRMTSRHLTPDERADGVVVFERPQFKESTERLQLQLAEADQVDRPTVISIPFTNLSSGGQK